MDTQSDDSGVASVKTFMEHLEDLRTALIRCAVVLVVGVIAATFFAPDIFRLLTLPLVKANLDPAKFLKILDVMGGFNLAMLIGILGGLVVSSPLMVLFIASFAFPGLTVKERRAVVRFGGVAALLFVLGVCMGYYLVLPVTLKILLGVGRWMGVSVDFLTAYDYVIFCLYVLLAFGLSFELPVILVLLGSLGIMESRQLRSARSYSIVFILIFAMVITPDTSAFSQIVMAVPMILMYEIAIWVMWFNERRAKSAG